MPFNLKGRSFLTLKDFSNREIKHLLELAKQLKLLKYAGIQKKVLQGKNIALIFEKASTRTRCAFAVACTDEGAHPEFLNKNDIQLGKKESPADTAKVMGRYFDGMEFRGFSHETIEILAKNAGVPVWNGLTDMYHPTQVLADFLTIEEHLGYLKGCKLAFVGDARCNTANSLLIGAAKMGLDFRMAAPESLLPDEEIVAYARGIAEENHAKISISSEVTPAIEGVDAIYTDVWVSMGEEHLLAERIKLLRPYQVDMKMVADTGNPSVLFLHCLPAFHDLHTEIGRDVYEKFGLKEMEVTDEVFQSQHSVVFDQAENRMHTIKAVMIATM